MAKVWTVSYYDHYEGDYLYGIFSTEDKAIEAFNTLKEKDPMRCGDYRHWKGYAIEEKELDVLDD